MDLTNLIELDDLIKKKNSFKKIFFYRICGTGMGSAAALMKEMGYEVEGGDTEYYPPMSHYLHDIKIPCYKLSEMKEEDFKKYDLIIVGNVIGRTTDHARHIEKLGIPFTSFPAALGAFVLKDKTVVGIAGTHGKTTTTYLMMQIFEKLGFQPGHLVGGVIDGIPSARAGEGAYFFIESDEYDSAYFHKKSKFHFYCIDHLVLTSLEFDHGDIFDSLEAIESEFNNLLPHVMGGMIISGDYPASKKIYEKSLSRKDSLSYLMSYGEQTSMGPHNIKSSPLGSEFELCFDEGMTEKFKTNLIGTHNILNLVSCILFAYSQNIPMDKIKSAVSHLEMVKRRQEERGYYRGALIIDDFAHHPTAVRLTLDGLKSKYPQKELVVVFAPSSATARSSYFQKEFTESLFSAKEVILVPSKVKTTVKSGENLDITKMIKDLNEHQVKASSCETLDALLGAIDRTVESKNEKLIVILSNGSILGLWESKFVQELNKK